MSVTLRALVLPAFDDLADLPSEGYRVPEHGCQYNLIVQLPVRDIS